MSNQKVASGDSPRKLAVVPNDFPKNYLLTDQANQIKNLIASNIANGFKPEYFPRVDSCLLSKEGAFILAFPDKHTATWLTLLIREKQIGSCPGLKVINIEDIPQFTKCHVLLPEGTKMDFKLFERQNRGVNTAYWRIIASPFATERNRYCEIIKLGRTHYELMIDESSMEVLKANNNILYHSLSKGKFNNCVKMVRDPTTGCL